jgi:hypothetical protein
MTVKTIPKQLELIDQRSDVERISPKSKADWRQNLRMSHRKRPSWTARQYSTKWRPGHRAAPISNRLFLCGDGRRLVVGGGIGQEWMKQCSDRTTGRS